MLEIKIVGARGWDQRARIRLYCKELLPKHILTPALKKFLKQKGVCLLQAKPTRTKGYFSRNGIHVLDAKTLTWRNFRENGAGKRGFFRASQVFIHELMHAVWTFGRLDDAFKQEVFQLHAKCPQRYFNYPMAERHAQEWFCDQFPRALLFESTCYPAFRTFLEKEYFKMQLPDICRGKNEVYP